MDSAVVDPLSLHAALQPAVDAGFDRIRIGQVLRFYDEPHRRYHDRAHLREMLDAARELAVDLTPAQALAVLFHDAIYVPGAARGTNEALSAQLLRLYATGVDAATVDRAGAIVLDTAEHVARRAESEAVLDLDLLRLAAAPPAFDTYSRQIFEEQRPLIGATDAAAAWRQFEARRQPFFRLLLARDAIFGLPLFYDRFETRARSNLRRALAGGGPQPARDDP